MKNYIDIDGKKLPLSEETLNSFKKLIKEEEVILVPDNIKLELWNESLGIQFNDNKQTLFYSECHDVYKVIASWTSRYVQCKLTPCKREDLEAGDTAYRINGTYPSFDVLDYYSKILNDKEHAYVYEGDIRVRGVDKDHWYKVEPV